MVYGIVVVVTTWQVCVKLTRKEMETSRIPVELFIFFPRHDRDAATCNDGYTGDSWVLVRVLGC